MTYSLLLLLFVALPSVALAALALRRRAQQRGQIAVASGNQPLIMLALLMIVATLYTIPWDNHLIALHVWSYERGLINGMTLGFIPLEEVAFFSLQTLLVGLWFFSLAPWLARQEHAVDGARVYETTSPRQREQRSDRERLIWAAGACLWLAALVVIRSGWAPGTYIGWEVAWALPPLALQCAFGGDILWRYRRLLMSAIVPATLYLCAVDALAIHAGIWTIDQRQTLGLVLGGTLPLEEVIFYTLTSALVVFGLALGVAAESKLRVQAYHQRLTVSLGKQ